MAEPKPSIEDRLSSILNPQPEPAKKVAEKPAAPPVVEPEPEVQEAAAASSEGAVEGADAVAEEADAESSTWFPERLEDLAEAGGWDVADLYKVKVKVSGPDGKPVEVPLGEWKDSYQQSAQLTALRQAEKAKTEEMFRERQKATEDLQHRLVEMNGLLQAAESTLVGNFQSIDWNTLRQTDPAEWAAKRSEFMDAAQGLAAIKQRAIQGAAQAVEQYQAEQANQYQQYLSEQLREASNLLPEFTDPLKVKQVQTETVGWLKESGYSDFEIALVSQSARLLKLVRDKMKVTSANTEAKKVVNAPKKFIRPGAAQPKGAKEAEAYKTDRTKLRKTGKVEDAAKVFKRMFGG